MRETLELIQQHGPNASADLLIKLISDMRPPTASDSQYAVEKLTELSAILDAEPGYRNALATYLVELVRSRSSIHLLTEAGVPNSKGFVSNLRDRFSRKFVPPIDDENELGSLLRDVFHRPNDFKWLSAVPAKLWMRLLGNMKLNTLHNTTDLKGLVISIKVLSHQIAALSVEPEITQRLPELDRLDSPFLRQNKLLTLFVEDYKEHRFSKLENEQFNELLDLLAEGRDYLQQVIYEKKIKGTSISLSYTVKRIIACIDRLDLLLHLFHEKEEKEFDRHLLKLLQRIVKAENQASQVLPYLKENVDFLAFNVVEHAAKKGDKYVAKTRKEYWSFLRASMLGGLIIAVFACFKILLDKVEVAPFSQALFFSLNYAACFILVKSLGGLIATKQPAMTASNIATAMDPKHKGEVELSGLRDLIIRVFHSQFISFVGNLLMALPFAFLLAKGFEMAAGKPLADDYKTAYLINGTHPFKSALVLYAALAGIYLSISGFISGYFDNKVIYNRLPHRIRSMRNTLLSQGLRNKLASYIDKHSGMFMGNLWLGIFLGSTIIVGRILGLPLDIRHIAFSASNFGISLANEGLQVTVELVALISLGLFLIGFINFIVSFGLTLAVVMESRSLSYRQLIGLARSIGQYVLRKPLSLFFPPKGSATSHSDAPPSPAGGVQ